MLSKSKYKVVGGIKKRILSFKISQHISIVCLYIAHLQPPDLQNLYYLVIKTISKSISKSKVWTNYSKKYEKFVVIDDVHKSTSMDFISKKILYTILIILICIVLGVYLGKMIIS